jgi:alpha-N-arabinofuranosidase
MTSLALLLALAAAARPAPAEEHVKNQARTFANPIIAGFHPDPSICRVGDDFYLVTSSFEYFPGVPIFHSRDLVHWQKLGHVLGDKRQLDLTGVPSSGGIFAPTLRYADGRFYMVTTLVGQRGTSGNFYVTATDPKGPWSDPIWLDRDGFDPSFLFADGKVYYNRDGKGADFNHPAVHMTTLDPKTGKLTGKLDGPATVIWTGTGGVWPEGAHVYKIKDRYYLLAAEGGTEYGHAEMAGRSSSPLGPFEPFAGNPILSHRAREGHPIQATGHADLVEIPGGGTWAVFLGIRPHGGRHHHLGRETFLAPVAWTPDGWPIIGKGGAVELEMQAPPLPPHPFPPEPARDDFDGRSLGPAWSFVRNPDPRDWSLAERPGFLRLWGSAIALDEVASPALVGRVQEHFAVRVRAQLDFAPKKPTEEAGLTVRANESFRYDLAVRATGGTGREAVLTSRLAGKSTVVARAPIGDGPVRLEVAADESSYRFAAEAGGKRAALGSLPAQALSAEEIGKLGKNYFTGVYVSMYATGNGQRSTAPADFDWFEYVPGN